MQIGLIMLSLRNRRRLETERLLQQAALRLAADHGADGVTVEAICAEAGVSTRTFFNYFPVKEAVFAISPPPFSEAAISDFLSSKKSLLDALVDLLVAQLSHLKDDRRIIRGLQRIAEQSPRIAAMQQVRAHAFDTNVAELIAKRLGRRKVDLECRVLASSVLAATKTVLDVWANDSKGDVASAIANGLPVLARFAEISQRSTRRTSEERLLKPAAQ